MDDDLVLVEFIKQWRGHDVGAKPKLTPERAKELIEQGYCKKPGSKRLKAAKPRPETVPKEDDNPTNP